MAKETVKCVCKVDKAFPLSPAGILKIIEMVLGVIQLALVAYGRGAYTTLVESPSLSQLATISHELNVYYAPALKFCLSMVIIIWLLTIVMFFLFLFCVPESAGGMQVWSIIDLILNVVWAIVYVVIFFLLCIFCGLPTDHKNFYSGALIAGIIFGLLLLIAYVISAVFSFLAMKAKKLY